MLNNIAIKTLASTVIGLAGFCSVNATALASGFAIAELSTAGVGTANALVANPDDVGAFAYNPAAMGFHDASSLALGTLFIAPSFSVKTSTGNQESHGADWVAAPMVSGALVIHDRWRAGVAVNAPFGLETRWGVNSFPALAGSSDVEVQTTAPPPYPPVPITVTVELPNGAEPTASKAEILDLTPTLAFRVTDDLSVSAGMDYYYAKKARLDSTLTTLSGDGQGYGYNLSALYAADRWSVGVAYHSAATVEIEGSYRPSTDYPALRGVLPVAQNASLDLNLPWRLQVGARFKITPDLAVEFDWTRTGWSEFEDITVKGVGGQVILTDKNNWKDVNAYRLGFTWQVLEQTQLRLGYSYDETPQEDDYFSPRIPDNDRHLLGIGVGQDLGRGWQVDFGYMYAWFDGKREVTGSRPYGGLGDDINGTTAVAGEYDANAHLIGLELTKVF
jgi:long-chain fatty acid transport protein